jgi:hypothetical protein
MGNQRTTFDKLQRERAKKAKADAKRVARQERSNETETVDTSDIVATNDSPAELLDAIAKVHERFEANQISFEEFEELKSDLFERLAALPIES